VAESSVERPGHTSGRSSPVSGSVPLIPDGLDAVLVLLRHGETEFIVQRRFQGQMEAPLTRLGERQATLAGRRLASPTTPPAVPIPDAAPYSIFHSPLGRARRSAELVAEELAAAGRPAPPLRTEPGFSEIAQGGWEGLTDAEITARFGDSLAGWRRWPERVHAPGGENLAEVQARVERGLSRVLTDLAAGTTPGTHDRHQVLGYEGKVRDERRWSLIVGHGGVFRVVACVLLGLPMDHFWNLDFGLAAISVVEIRAGRAVLRSLNLDSHLGRASAAAEEESRDRNARGAL
jgi:broad specificity phosphatase PhoE